MTIVLLIGLGLGVIIAAVILYGAAHWRTRTQVLINRLESARRPIDRSCYDPQELEKLPPPVQRYFRLVLTENQPLVAAVSMAQAGTFNLSASAESWKPFTSTQRVITTRPGFLWNACMMPTSQVKVS